MKQRKEGTAFYTGEGVTVTAELPGEHRAPGQGCGSTVGFAVPRQQSPYRSYFFPLSLECRCAHILDIPAVA